jgi:hypothetical protein
MVQAVRPELRIAALQQCEAVRLLVIPRVCRLSSEIMHQIREIGARSAVGRNKRNALRRFISPTFAEAALCRDVAEAGTIAADLGTMLPEMTAANGGHSRRPLV